MEQQQAKNVSEIYATSVYVPGPENQRAGKCWGVTKLMLQLVTSQVPLFQKLAFAFFVGKRFQWTLRFTVCLFYTPNCNFSTMTR